MTSQGKGIFVATWQLPDAEQTDKCFNLVSQRHANTNHISRQFVASKSWSIVILDSKRNLFRFTFV